MKTEITRYDLVIAKLLGRVAKLEGWQKEPLNHPEFLYHFSIYVEEEGMDDRLNILTKAWHTGYTNVFGNQD